MTVVSLSMETVIKRILNKSKPGYGTTNYWIVLLDHTLRQLANNVK